MHSPQFRPLPAPTRAEAEFIDCYLEVLDHVGRIGPARGSDTYGAPRAAQAPASRAAALRDALALALALAHERGEAQLHAATPARVLRVLDGERRTGRVTMPPVPTS